VLGVHHAVLELDPLQQPERVGVRVEVGLDLGVVREVRVVRRHREVLERQPVLAGVDVQRPVRTAVPVGVAERPVAADPVGGFEAGVRHPVVAEHLAGGQPADPGADHRRRRSLERHAPDARHKLDTRQLCGAGIVVDIWHPLHAGEGCRRSTTIAAGG
jgi:hypothetical protein